MRFTYQTGAQPLAGYTIQRGIHRGGFGEVYFARSHGGKEVALKLLHHDDQDVEIRGVSHCLNLKHPNLINLFDLKADTQGDHWVVMEYVSGSSLEDVLASFPDGLPLGDVAEWLTGLVSGVAFMHERGIVHRDLKPSNVYRENGVVKIGDVGLSKRLDSGRRQHTQSVGTVYYMAPEVAKGQYGPEVDVYSLGVMLYEMISGKLPFTGETTAEILMKHLTAQADLTPIPVALRPTVARALEKDPDKRTAGVRLLEQEFMQALATIDPSVVPVASTVRPPVPLVANGYHKGNGYQYRPDGVPVGGLGASGGQGRPQVNGKPINGKRASRAKREERLRPLIRTWSEQLPELTVSISFAAVVASIMSGGFYSAISHMHESLSHSGTRAALFPGIENVVHFVAISIIGSWFMLAGYAWSNSNERRCRRRWFIRTIVGALIGTSAFALDRFLMINTPAAASIKHAVIHRFAGHELAIAGNPTWMGYVCFFVFWMAIRTWSGDMHPLRRDQFSFGRTVFAVGMAYVTSIVFEYPQWNAMLIAGTISTTVQLASRWNAAPRVANGG